ncbi:hypothetical protein [Pseudomonas indica]|uniref:hypothetical protein n=1 Tax=Pseudomonas indica TaxID=137658 RepID=UPI0023F66A22|nr:hypothetical protein [Pseudomonas indica]MBU3059592.1 hypothetical protein [Pseudomonas indica]
MQKEKREGAEERAPKKSVPLLQPCAFTLDEVVGRLGQTTPARGALKLSLTLVVVIDVPKMTLLDRCFGLVD